MNTSSRPLEGLSAVITGATRGIGFAIAGRLLADGAAVLATGTRDDGAGPEGSEYAVVDFADTDATLKFAGHLRQNAPDILINNAGINKNGTIADFNPEDFQRIQRINVEAPFLLCQAVIPNMTAKGWGRIVNIASIWSKISKAGRGAYSASKFALDGITTSLSAEIAADGILANCVSPGFIETDLTRNMLGVDGMAKIAATIPLGRLGQPDEVAALVTWLAGKENTYVSGQNFVIDGGFTRV